MKKHKINIVTLGCSKNLVDSEVLMKQIASNHAEVVHNSSDPDYKTVIINTCGFINDAKKESIDAILRFAQAKTKGIIDHLFVIGCLSERYLSELQKEIPEVNGFFGIDDLSSIIEKLGFRYDKSLMGERVLTTPSHYAYLKISEGCDRSCSFCAIPLIRGKHISKPPEEIMHEAENLASAGVKELILIAQDLTYYGYDLNNRSMLADLLSEITRIPEIEWIRLHYTYPANFPLELLDIINANSKICKYIDLPFQHISDKILVGMRRNIDSFKTTELINQIRSRVPGVAIRTTLLVGHPGETEKEFKELKEFVVKNRFERLGVFTYSEEEGTYSASHYKDSVPESVKKQRASEIMKLQQQISKEQNLSKTGVIFRIIVDRKEGEYFVGRTEYDSPEVDNEVLVKDNGHQIEIGNILNVKITSASEYDLFGEII
ncbi:MAG: 30S ribosomal protein S12 methylthiotransferase RimO [Bacteroidia bacterium]|nr:30S ribosomal protein S12 methylthiotransferase RimO [Bacteroidia bacterium]